MLAQNFKTPTELRLTEVEFVSLVKVLGMLERGELHHEPHALRSGFNMATWRINPCTKCGTVACIAGWAHHISDGKAFPWLNGNPADPITHAELFVPLGALARSGRKSFSAITPAEAATALRNFLVTGDPRWDEALASS